MEVTRSVLIVVALVICGALSACRAQQCGSQAGNAPCAGNLCCSKWGWCGTGSDYCGDGCQSGPCGGGGGEVDEDGGVGNGQDEGGGEVDEDGDVGDGEEEGGDVPDIVSVGNFNRFLSQRTSAGCPANGFYTRSAFLSAASAFRSFGTTGDIATQKREIAAFFANVAYESGSGCYKETVGKGPNQIMWNYNYLVARKALGFDDINDPSMGGSNPMISMKKTMWYWMTQDSPTCHSAITNGQGFGATIKVINGDLECGPNGNKVAQQARITLYKSFCSILGVDPGNNLTC